MPREIILLHMCTINEDHMITDASKRISIPVCPEKEIYTFLYTDIFNAGCFFLLTLSKIYVQVSKHNLSIINYSKIEKYVASRDFM